MAAKKPDIKADKMPVDQDEQIHIMEPLLLGSGYRRRDAITDLALDLARKSAGFRRSLPESATPALAALVRSMNCYYSNLIEGHDTHPIDIERALRSDFSHDRRQRDLQVEAAAHIDVQRWVDEGGLAGGRAFTVAGIREIHRRFCSLLPADLLRVEGPDGKRSMRVEPGEFRTAHVQVGRHVAISPGALPRFLERFEQVYTRTGKTESIIAAAAAHHRLAWLHPFLDGNGRVARLMSHAHLVETLETGALWSVARGLARNVGEYKRLLDECDGPRKGPLDGRGALSESALGEFTEFFLGVCIDQVDFMESLMQPERLRARILLWAEEEIRAGALPGGSVALLQVLLYRGELSRADAAIVLASGERQTRRVTSVLLERGVVTSENHRAPLRLAFPATLAGRWLPGLFPDHPTASRAAGARYSG